MSTEPACSLDCGPAGNCYIGQSRGDEVDVVIEDDDEGVMDLEDNNMNLKGKQATFRQRCQCPLGRAGDRCQFGKRVYLFYFLQFLYLSCKYRYLSKHAGIDNKVKTMYEISKCRSLFFL